MSERHRDSDDVFAERLARVLGRPERFGEEFERSLVAAIKSERPIRYRIVPRTRAFSPRWWRTPAMSISPLASMAVAAGLAAVAVFGTLRVDRGALHQGARVVATNAVVHDTVTLVRFVFAGQAKSVSLVGDFNRWGAEPTPLTAVNGVWTASIPLPNGRHE